ncbi:hypothetical protein Pcinc_018115 [Petrolisthes cinctipes]|uniref:Alanine dehydrogenase/pyridine nucleotide transhydrogenase NAD(H)-binding domain-containing protein n=1 Tax=Petrolisthes cinctipes TaxID=88211 RepID=A0AAE1KN34_PETCI|nr:hypothetical protein Pcinc_018115 [Petrolisthes cinctipes]
MLTIYPSSPATKLVYCCVVSRKDHIVKKDGGKYSELEYNQHPEHFTSLFAQKVAPYASVIINGISWPVNSPRLLTTDDAKDLLRPVNNPSLYISQASPQLPHRLLAISDVTADPGGSIEFVKECTAIDTPFYLYDVEQNKLKYGSMQGPGVLICSINNMPTQLPLEATEFFGSLLLPHIYDILQSDNNKSFEEHSFMHEVEKAVITSEGKLTKNFEFIADLRAQN